MEGPLCFPRGYFLPLPTQDLEGALRQRARYSDSSGFSRSLLSSLETPVGTRLLPAEAATFWTEHSDRAGVDSWCASLGLPAPDRAFLGRWAVKGSTDLYVRTAVRVVENLQVLAAKKAQEAAGGGADHYGEEHLLQELHGHLLRHGCPEDTAMAAVERLTHCNYTLRPEQEPTFRAALAAAPAAPTLDEIQEEEAEDEDDEDDEEDEEPMETAPLHAEVVELAAKQLLPPPPTPHGFVVSITRRGKFRRLHLGGVCRLTPGVHYKDFEVWGDMMPGESEVQAGCARCLPQGKPAAPLEPPDLISGSSSSSGEER